MVKPEHFAQMSLIEKILAGIIAVLVLLWFYPGTKKMLEQSKTAPKDWPAAILPLGVVILLIFLMIAYLKA